MFRMTLRHHIFVTSTPSVPDITPVSSSRIASGALPSRDNTITGPCFPGCKLVNFLQISISFNQSVNDFELDKDGALLLLLAIL